MSRFREPDLPTNSQATFTPYQYTGPWSQAAINASGLNGPRLQVPYAPPTTLQDRTGIPLNANPASIGFMHSSGNVGARGITGTDPMVQLNPRQYMGQPVRQALPVARVTPQQAGPSSFHGTRGGYGYQRDAGGNVSRIPRAGLVRDRTGSNIGTAAGMAANAVVPGLGLAVKPLASWGSRVFRDWMSRRNTPDTLAAEQTGVPIGAGPANDPAARMQRNGMNLTTGMGGTYLAQGVNPFGSYVNTPAQSRATQMHNDMHGQRVTNLAQPDELTMGPSRAVNDPDALADFAERMQGGNAQWRDLGRATREGDYGAPMPAGSQFTSPRYQMFLAALERMRAARGGG